MKAISMAVVVLVGCAGRGKPAGSDPRDLSDSSSEDKRSIRYEPGQFGFEHSLEVRRSKAGVPHELHNGGIVTNGDRIRVSVTTYEAAHLYLAFCAGRELTIFPSQRGVRITAGTNIQVPGSDGALIIAGEPGPEVLYVIVSRDELSLADPRLARALAESRGSDAGADVGADVDCANLDAELAKPAGGDSAELAKPAGGDSAELAKPADGGSAELAKPADGGSAKSSGSTPTTNVLHGKVVRSKARPASIARRDRNASGPSATAWAATGSGTSTGRAVPGDDHAHPPVDPGVGRDPEEKVRWYGDTGINSPKEVVATDADGIAVVRHWFKHEAPASPP